MKKPISILSLSLMTIAVSAQSSLAQEAVPATPVAPIAKPKVDEKTLEQLTKKAAANIAKLVEKLTKDLDAAKGSKEKMSTAVKEFRTGYQKVRDEFENQGTMDGKHILTVVKPQIMNLKEILDLPHFKLAKRTLLTIADDVLTHKASGKTYKMDASTRSAASAALMVLESLETGAKDPNALPDITALTGTVASLSKLSEEVNVCRVTVTKLSEKLTKLDSEIEKLKEKVSGDSDALVALSNGKVKVLNKDGRELNTAELAKAKLPSDLKGMFALDAQIAIQNDTAKIFYSGSEIRVVMNVTPNALPEGLVNTVEIHIADPAGKAAVLAYENKQRPLHALMRKKRELTACISQIAGVVTEFSTIDPSRVTYNQAEVEARTKILKDSKSKAAK